ncbi:P-loop containing nucleoside triphosphate hydrolase protein [Lasiosphaeria hispida]|uniref:P-loop containing nucleoside triphosphate hydrolase protein n=1 Tax=Lasiosphaeria hispida TaxID=260671 RepID=A0AAJ0HJ34_9PEZI|nr:P-loop containing nucleoside triphosphate hydrolase protein [Lasiosphaeria hispida]
MDYHAIHGHDVSSFDLPSTHRLPTVSAAQALEEFQSSHTNFIPTGLGALDASLGSSLNGQGEGGIQKGHVTEIWGPPGSGKTTFGIQLAVHCLREGRGVVWVDGFHPVSSHRLRTVADHVAEGEQETTPGRPDAFTHYTCPSLPHFIALLCRPTAFSIPEKTSLIVVDSLSALVNHAFPRVMDGKAPVDAKGNKGPSLSARKLQVLQYVVGGLQKLAATQDLAIVILTQCVTKMQVERGATLVPAINATVWDQGISTRLVLFRDWILDRAESHDLYFVGVEKVNGKEDGGLVNSTSPFRIEQGGLVSVDLDSTQTSRGLSSTPVQKRKLDDTNFEIPDSDDEDYGWQDDDDDALPPNPSQWQGSEDILLRREPESDEEALPEEEETLDSHHMEDRAVVPKDQDQDASELETE